MMSSKRGGGQSNRGGGQSNRGDGNKPASKGKYIAGGTRYDDDRLNQAVQYVNVDGNWEVISRKNKYRPGNGAPSKQWAAQTPKPNGGRGNGQARAPNNTWAAQSGGRCSGGDINYTYNPAPNAIPPPLHSGWNWNDRPANSWQLGNNIPEDVEDQDEEDVEDESKTGDVNESDDDDEFLTDESDSDKTPKTHDERKKNKWYADLFKTLEGLTLEEINEPRSYHCPACQNSPDAIHWYRTLPSLLTHAKTKESKRVKIHRNLAVILEEELQTRGANIVASRESYGQWKGLNESVKDKEIVWPPMVVIMNTQLKMDKNETWIGMGNDELLHYFKDYAAVRARHLYGQKGHRGMSVLIFESCAVGYGEAERLSKHFEHEGSDRDAWDHSRNLFYPGGKRQLYGYMATKKDMDFFNRHSHEKMKLEFELVSYQEKVVNQLKQMNEDNQQLNWYKNKILKEKRRSKALEESFDLVSQKLRKTEEEKRIVRERTQRYHEQNKEEMDYQEQFFKDQLKIIQDARNANEGHFDKLQEEERIRVEKSYSVVDPQKRDEKLEEMKGFEEEREKLMKRHEEKKAEMKSRHWKEEIELEEGFDAELTQLMEKYTPKDQVQNA